MRNILEELFDTLLFVGVVMITLALFAGYWGTSYRIRCSELIVDTFLDELSTSKVRITSEYKNYTRTS